MFDCELCTNCCRFVSPMATFAQSYTFVIALANSLPLAFFLIITLALALIEARARDEPHDVPQEQVLVLAPKHSLESRVGWSGVEWSVG